MRAGKIPIEIVNGKMLIPFGRAQETLERTLDLSQNPTLQRSRAGEAAGFQKLRTAQLARKVQEQQLDLAVKEGTLINRDMALRHGFQFARQLLDHIQAFPMRYAAALASELGVDAGRLQIALERRLRECLIEIATRELRL